MKRAVYIAGPMTGYEDLNYPAFAKASAAMRELGFGVVSPAELNPVETLYEDAMRNDIRALVDCSHILLLDGWEKSKGATLENHIAEVMGIKRIDINGVEVESASAPTAELEEDDDLAGLIIEVNAHPLMMLLSEAMTANIEVGCDCPDPSFGCQGLCAGGKAGEKLHRLRKALRAHLEKLRATRATDVVQDEVAAALTELRKIGCPDLRFVGCGTATCPAAVRIKIKQQHFSGASLTEAMAMAREFAKKEK